MTPAPEAGLPATTGAVSAVVLGVGQNPMSESLAQSAPLASVPAAPKAQVVTDPAPKTAHSSAELVEMQLGVSADAPLCFSCGTKMQRAGSCYICEGCGSTSGCS